MVPSCSIEYKSRSCGALLAIGARRAERGETNGDAGGPGEEVEAVFDGRGVQLYLETDTAISVLGNTLTT